MISKSITGTFCDAKDGCAGVNQVVGSHDVSGAYEATLVGAREAAHDVIAALTPGASRANALSLDVQFLGNLLMGNGDGGEGATITVYNQLAHHVTEAISVQVPVCKVRSFCCCPSPPPLRKNIKGSS